MACIIGLGSQPCAKDFSKGYQPGILVIACIQRKSSDLAIDLPGGSSSSKSGASRASGTAMTSTPCTAKCSAHIYTFKRQILRFIHNITVSLHSLQTTNSNMYTRVHTGAAAGNSRAERAHLPISLASEARPALGPATWPTIRQRESKHINIRPCRIDCIATE